jgi:S-DNA-T family DNA segregation ATPase FtsK/SpoIIIE
VRSKATNPTFTHDSSSGLSQAPGGRRHEVVGIILFASTVLFGLALFSYDARGGENWIGPVGETIAAFFVSAFGLGAAWLPIELALATLQLLGVRLSHSWATRVSSVVVFMLLGCALVHLVLGETQVFGGHLAGGVLGEIMGEVMRSLVGSAGAYVICIAALLITLVVRTSLSFIAVSRRVGTGAAGTVQTLYGRMRESVDALADAWREAQAIEAEERARRQAAEAPKIIATQPGTVTAPGKTAPGTKTAPAKAAPAKTAPGVALVDEEEDDEEDEDEEPEAAASAPASTKAPRSARKSEPVIVAPRQQAIQKKKDAGMTVEARSDGKMFMLPPTTLLTEAPENIQRIDEQTLKDNAVRLCEKLEAYGVRGRVDEIHPGPVVTMYEVEPASGTKVSKIASLADDLAMALAAEKVRIVAPIPGKARVGFELPNKYRETVYLRELLEDERWRKHDGLLPVCFGKDIAGQPVFGDLSKMPHLLVAGATGSGKSVGLNVLLVSLLMKKTPEQVRLLMIDPKVVELAVFDAIPHMLLPVVTDMKKASRALRWAVDEMERRYQLFADCGARNVITYNQRIERVIRGEITMDQLMPRRAGKMRATGPDGEEVLLDPDMDETPDANAFEPKKLPSIVVVVDEFADLMMVAAKDVESAIARLAQKARAAGIHVILATQRPSVDVITGMIKANFPSRVGFKVSQREDSKTILGRNGAEHLLGMGDMLTLMPGASDLQRVHCAYISEDEVKGVCDFLRLQGSPVYDEDIVKPRDDEDEDGGGGIESASEDPLYDKAVAVVAQAGYCSISHIQRQLSVGYNKAAKLVERMEKEGVVGPATGKAGGRREVLIQAR